MTAITIGMTDFVPKNSSLTSFVIQLPLGDKHGITLMPGQMTWKWEFSLVSLICPVAWPVLVMNENGEMRKLILGIDNFQVANPT